MFVGLFWNDRNKKIEYRLIVDVTNQAIFGNSCSDEDFICVSGLPKNKSLSKSGILEVSNCIYLGSHLYPLLYLNASTHELENIKKELDQIQFQCLVV